MKIILTSVGTRGDMEPFLAISEILREKGHQVICAFPEQFRNLAEESCFKFSSLGSKYIDMLESDIGKAAMGSSASGFKKFIANIKLASQQTGANKEIAWKQYEIITEENPDRVLYNAKGNYPIIWGLENKGKNILISAVPYLHYVKENTHIAFNSNFGNFFNKLTYSLYDFGISVTAVITKKWLKITKKITRKQIRKEQLMNKAVYSISPTLFPRPDYWGDNLKVLGFHERNKTINWHPDNELIKFIKKHDKIIMITFGSMLNPEPEVKTNIIINILEKNKIPAIINTASGGLVKPDNFHSDIIYFVSQIPYDWIFPRMYGVIHHGGSGTTHLSLKYRCATMIIPHIIDQFVWNRIVYQKGAGPKGIKISKMTAEDLEEKIIDLMNNPFYKQNAKIIADQIEMEDFKDELYEFIIDQ
jgi:UDP:flavonoid glycosyltransferase YjiC (YdhE family)